MRRCLYDLEHMGCGASHMVMCGVLDSDLLLDVLVALPRNCNYFDLDGIDMTLLQSAGNPWSF